MKKIVVALLLGLVVFSLFANGSTEEPKGETVEVEMWIYDEMASTDDKAMVQAARDFEAKNPGIEIVFQNVPHRGLMDKFLAASVTGEVPDVLHE